MQLAIFAKTFPGDIEANMAAVAAAGISAVQYNLSIAGIDTVPAAVDPTVVTRITKAASRHGVTLAAISGTFNTAHPDPAVRQAGIDRFPVLAATAAALGVPVITLSSGSRDEQNMWRYHRENSTPQAWRDSRDSLVQLARIAEAHDVTIAIEPEHTNVVATAELGRTMLDEVGSDHLKIVYDAANLIDTTDLSAQTMAATISSSIDILGPRIALAHAKELVADRAPVPPGAGVLPWPLIIDALAGVGYTGPVVTHGLPADGVPTAIATLSGLIDRHR